MAAKAPKETLFDAVVVTAEVIGHELSPAAAKAITRELAAYPEPAVVGALRRCQRELSGRLTLAAILQRLDDGHPGPEEAWALCTRDESATVVWTDEIASAYGVACKLDDDIAARMAFKECYERNLREARAERRPARWWPSLGHDAAGRGGPLLAAVEAKRLTPDEARRFLSPDAPGGDLLEDRLRKLEGLPPIPRLGAAGEPPPAEFMSALKRIGGGGGK